MSVATDGRGLLSTGGRYWVRAARASDVPPGSALEFESGGRTYALFRLGDGFSCLDGLCPHQGGRLASGPRVVDGCGREAVTCPRRGCLRWRFDLRDGTCVQQGRVRCGVYEVRVEGGDVLVALDQGGTAGVPPSGAEDTPWV